MEDKYFGMTVNERLYVGGLIDKYYKAINEKNVVKIIFILFRVDLKEESIIDILKAHNLYSESYII